jgi:hypothetical protein
MEAADEAPEPWLLDAPLFLETSDRPPVRRHRPAWQGDVFADVPLSLTGKPKGSGEAKTQVRVTTVMLMGHPCSMYAGGNLAVLQNVAEVRPFKAREEGFGPPWEGFYQILHLPGLRAGEDWAVDFNILGSVHFKYLEGRRVACLSRHGLAALHCRYAYHSLRIRPEQSARVEDLRGLANEIDLWERWCERGLKPESFQAWLGDPGEEGEYAGVVRRDLLDYAPDFLDAELPAAKPA